MWVAWGRAGVRGVTAPAACTHGRARSKAWRDTGGPSSRSRWWSWSGRSILIALGEKYISSSLAGILLAGVPLIVVVVAPFMGVHEEVGPRRLIGMAIGLIGVVVLLGLDTAQGEEGWLGAACILLAAVGYAVGPLIVQRHLAGADSLSVVSLSVAIGAAVLTIPALFTAPPAIPSSVAIGSIVLGMICTALGLMLFVFVIARAEPAMTNTTASAVQVEDDHRTDRIRRRTGGIVKSAGS